MYTLISLFLHQRNVHSSTKIFCNSWEYVDAVTLQPTGRAKLRWTRDNSVGTVYKNIVKVYYNQKGKDACLPLAKATREGKWFRVIKWAACEKFLLQDLAIKGALTGQT